MSAALWRLARLLDLDKPTAGDRTAWTVRTAHGVHLVELEQAVTGTRIRVDGAVVGRSPTWAFSEEPFHFAVGGSGASLTVLTDTRAGTLRPSLLVGGEPVPQDVPAWRRRRVRPIRWRPLLGRVGYVLGAVLVVSAAAGDPVRGWVGTALTTTADVAWLAAVRGVDPFGLLPAWVRAIVSSRAGMLLAGIELIALVTVAGNERTRGRLPLLRSSSRARRALGWGVVICVAAFVPTLLDS